MSNIRMNNFYCAAPWRGLHINPQGDVKTCCAGDPSMAGNLDSNTIEEILNSKTMSEIRQSLAQGIAHEYCRNCVKAEKFGADSERDWHNRSNTDIDYTQAGDRYHYPVIFDVRWNITCNLSCNYCLPDCSSKWASIKNIPFKSGTRPYYEQVCDFLAQHYEHITEVALVGGEPLLLPENDRLLDVIPDTAIVTLITNMSVDFEKNKIVQKLIKRKNVGWSMSFDNIGERFEYVRHGADWNLLQKNLGIVKQLIQNNQHHGGINAVYNIYSATRLCEIRQFAQDNNTTVRWQNLFWPRALDPFLHGPYVAELASQEIHKFYELGIATDDERVFFDHALEKYSQAQDNPAMQEQFRKHIHDNETIYHPDKAGQFARLWPELVL
jgi:radical SAM protein with 4Fe4S-binding SPASM domain